MMSIEPFNRLVKLAARAFYDDKSTKENNQTKTERNDNKGFAVVVLDALTRCSWVSVEDLAKDLKLSARKLRQTLYFLEEEKLVAQSNRRERAKAAKLYSAAVAETADGHPTGGDGDEKIKLRTQTYCCLDYPQICDVLRYRLHRMKKKLKEELEDKYTVQQYLCLNCGKRYDAFDAPRLFSPEDDFFHCESCNRQLVAESHKLATQENEEGDDNARWQHHDKLKDLLRKMEVQLKPLMDQLSRVKDLPVPEFGTLQAWEIQANTAACAANGYASAHDPSKSLQGLGFGGTPMPFVGETKVEVSFTGIVEKEENSKFEGANSAVKPLPPWMIKQGMNLTEEQRGEVKLEAKTEGTVAAVDSSDDKKSATEKVDVEYSEEEIFKAYYAALIQEQQAAVRRKHELSNAAVSSGVNGSYSKRQVGMKSKREKADEGDNNVGWDEPPPAGSTSESCKVNDLNVQAEDAFGEDEDDIDWEDG